MGLLNEVVSTTPTAPTEVLPEDSHDSPDPMPLPRGIGLSALWIVGTGRDRHSMSPSDELRSSAV
jgi:hypothetical protein